MTTLGKYRHLTQCSTAGGHFVILAIDHRDNLLESLNKQRPTSAADFGTFKQQIMRDLLPHASAVLTDPEYGFGAGIAARTIGGAVGLLSPLEVTNYTLHPSQRETHFIEGWSIEKIKRVGGAGVKLLLYYHPAAPQAAQKHALVERIVADCTRYDIPFFLEPIAYSPDADKKLSSDELRAVVVESARIFSRMGIDVLKTEFPVDVRAEPDETVWVAALAALNAACAVPWALLSGGVDYPSFKRQTELACQAGASGVMVGRAVWAEAVTLEGAARSTFLQTTAQQRMAELAAICAAQGQPWHATTPAPQVEDGWYRDYPPMR